MSDMKEMFEGKFKELKQKNKKTFNKAVKNHFKFENELESDLPNFHMSPLYTKEKSSYS